jgi:hypothetical protein
MTDRARADTPPSGDEIVTKLSPRSVTDTVERISEVVAERGRKLF